MQYLLRSAKLMLQGGAKPDHFHQHNSTYASGKHIGQSGCRCGRQLSGGSRGGHRVCQDGIEAKSLVGRVMRGQEVLDFLSFLYLCIFIILCRLVPLVNELPFCHSVRTSCSTDLT